MFQMQELDLSYCKLSDEGLIALSSCLDKIEILEISLDQSISTDAIRTMAESITKRTHAVINRDSKIITCSCVGV